MVVVGAGIAGITAALLLKREGHTVALLESKRIVRGATGYTTAKVTAGHGLAYSRLERSFGAEAARLYADANATAIDRIAALVADTGIDCDFERKSNLVYAEPGGDVGAIEAEAQAARRAGLPASFVRRVGLPYPVAGAVHLEDQAQFHPRRYLLGLAELIRGDGSHVLELTRALAVDEAGVRTDRGIVRARDVFVATQVPIVDRGVFFAKAHPHRSYAIAARIRAEDAPDGMFINAGKPTRSLRTASDEDGLLLLVGGQGHRTGDEPDTESRYRVLEGFAREHFGANEFPYRWSTQDYMPVDGLPYVGRLTRRSRHVYVATGFQKWGMTNGTAAAIIVADLIAGRDNPWSRLFDANRLTPRASLRRFVQENASVALHFVGDRLRIGRRGTLDDVAPGEGRILLLNGRRTAIYRDDDGAVHLLSPSCTHLGCLVAWNPAERSWDCPCHGSRFAADGMVIQGPAVEDLRPAPPNEGLRTPARSRY